MNTNLEEMKWQEEYNKELKELEKLLIKAINYKYELIERKWNEEHGESVE
ncbi:hypothetical protein [Clostridium sp.]